MVDVVGLRFVTEGYNQVNLEIRDYTRSLQTMLGSVKRVANGVNAAAEEYLRQAAAYRNTTAALDRLNSMQRDSARAVQEIVNNANMLQRANKSAADSAEFFTQALRRQEAETANAARETQAFYRTLLQIEQPYKSAEDSAEVFVQTLRRQEAQTEMLARAYNPLMAASIAYERQVAQLNQAHEMGVIDAEQLRVKLEQVGNAYTSVGQDALRAREFTNQFGTVTQLAGVKTNRFGMVAQQVGYQVGDFFVQIQSGTNAFVAFGQQATQLAGLLPGLAGAIVGIGISVGTMLLAAWDRTRNAADDTADEVDNLSDTLSRLDNVQRATALNFETNLAAVFGDSATKVGALVARLKELEFAAAIEPVVRMVDAATVGIDRVKIALDAIEALEADRAAGRPLSRALESLLQESYALVEANLAVAAGYDQIRAAMDAVEASDSTDTLVTSLAEALRLAEAMGGPVGDDLAAAIVDAAREAGVLEQITGRVENVMSDTADEAGRLTDAIIRAAQNAFSLRQAMQSLAAPFRTAMEELTFEVSLASLDATEKLVATRVRALEQRMRAENERVFGFEVGPTAEQRQQLAEFEAALRANAPALVRDGGGGGRTPPAQATLADVEGALRREQDQRRQLLELSGQERAVREQYFDIVQRLGDAESNYTEETLMNAARRIEAAKRENDTRESNLQTILAGINAQLDRERQILELRGIERRELEIKLDLIDQLRAAEIEYNEDVIEIEARKIAAREQEMDEMRRYQQEMKRVSSTLGNLFMSAIDGANSFRSALSGVLRQLASALANRAFMALLSGFPMGSTGGSIISIFGSLLGSANGNVFSGGNLMPFANGAVIANDNRRGSNVIPFANGGIVDSPVMFPMRGNRTGLMGEAGPEAIMPLRRGRDGKLGVAAKPQEVQVDVRVHMDENGQWQAEVERIADRRVQRAEPRLTQRAVSATYAANSERKFR